MPACVNVGTPVETPVVLNTQVQIEAFATPATGRSPITVPFPPAVEGEAIVVPKTTAVIRKVPGEKNSIFAVVALTLMLASTT